MDFVDTNNGWHFSSQDHPTNITGRGLYVTHDGGQTWSEITPSIDIGEFEYWLPYEDKMEGFGDFDFINPDVGLATFNFAYLDAVEIDISLLLKTTDGGFTWTSWVPHWQPAQPGR